MTTVLAQSDNRRFLVSLAVALLAHLALALLISTVPEKRTHPQREYELLRVTLSPGSEASGQERTGPDRNKVAKEARAQTGLKDQLSAPGSRAPTRVSPAEESAQESATPEIVEPAKTPSEAVEPLPETESQQAAEPAPEPANTEAVEPAEVTAETAAQEPGVAPVPEDNLSPGRGPSTDTPTAPLRPAPGQAGDGADGGTTGARRQEGLPTLEPTRYVAPEYPEAARRAGWTGSAVVELTVGRRGRVEAFELVESSGYDELDEAALRAVRLWRFPRVKAGEQSIHRFEFRLEQHR